MRCSGLCTLALLGSLHTASGFGIPGFRPLAAAAGSLRSRAARALAIRRPQMNVVSPYASKPYPIGTPGTPWGAEERAAWLARQVNQRSYADEVLQKIDALRSKGLFTVEQYGALSVDPDRYPLFVFKTQKWDVAKPACLVTGGVHGYETSGVQGALLFLQTEAEKYADKVNLVVAPCVSPWGYEHIQRWNNNADDPNRNFVAGSPCDECNALRDMLGKLKAQGASFSLHIDLHETTNSDEEEFMPAKAARDGVKYEQGYIPDGFYLVGDSENPEHDWHSAMIEAVKKVTHIAPPDVKGEILACKPTQDGERAQQSLRAPPPSPHPPPLSSSPSSAVPPWREFAHGRAPRYCMHWRPLLSLSAPLPPPPRPPFLRPSSVSILPSSCRHADSACHGAAQDALYTPSRSSACVQP